MKLLLTMIKYGFKFVNTMISLFINPQTNPYYTNYRSIIKGFAPTAGSEYTTSMKNDCWYIFLNVYEDFEVLIENNNI